MKNPFSEAKAFVEQRLRVALGDTEASVAAALQDGTLLCRLCESLNDERAEQQRKTPSKAKTPSKKVMAAGGSGALFHNWEQFGTMCHRLGVNGDVAISQTSFGKGKSMRPVWRCIVELKACAAKRREAHASSSSSSAAAAANAAAANAAAANDASMSYKEAVVSTSGIIRGGRGRASHIFSASPMPMSRHSGGAATPGMMLRRGATPSTGMRSGIGFLVDAVETEELTAAKNDIKMHQCVNSVQKRKHDGRLQHLLAQIAVLEQAKAESETLVAKLVQENKAHEKTTASLEATITAAVQQHANEKEERKVQRKEAAAAIAQLTKTAEADAAAHASTHAMHTAAAHDAEQQRLAAAAKAQRALDALRSEAAAASATLQLELSAARAESARLQEQIATAMVDMACCAEREQVARAQLHAVHGQQLETDKTHTELVCELREEMGVLREESSELKSAAVTTRVAHDAALTTAVAAAESILAARLKSEEDARATTLAAAHATEVEQLSRVADEHESERNGLADEVKLLRTQASSATMAHADEISATGTRIASLEAEAARSISPSQLAGITTELSSSYAALRQSVVANAAMQAQEFIAMQTKIGSSMKLLQDERDDMRTTLHEESARRRVAHNKLQRLRGNIRVFCRVRPLLPHEIAAGAVVAIQTKGHTELELETVRRSAMSSGGRAKANHFSFDQVFSSTSTQKQVWAEVKPLVVSVLDGFHACIFAYGQTGSGKTYTMGGTASEPGLNRHALSELFTEASRQRKAGLRMLAIKVSMVEIYNENVRDLLCTYTSSESGSESESAAEAGGMEMDADAAGSDDVEAAVRPQYLNVRQGPDGAFVDGAKEIAVATLAEVERIMVAGNMQRSVSSTSCNSESSRSHSLIMVTVESSVDAGAVQSSSSATTLRRGRLVLVDLAGSERLKKSEVEGAQLKEAQHINKSLSAFGDVVQSLSRKASHIPYRNSTLTFLLQNSLGSDNKVLMFANVSPCASHADETLCSLQFAARVNNVQLGAAKKKEDPKLMGKLKKTAESLKAAKSALAAKSGKIEKLSAKNKELSSSIAGAKSAVEVERKRAAKLETELRTAKDAARAVQAKRAKEVEDRSSSVESAKANSAARTKKLSDELHAVKALLEGEKKKSAKVAAKAAKAKADLAEKAGKTKAELAAKVTKAATAAKVAQKETAAAKAEAAAAKAEAKRVKAEAAKAIASARAETEEAEAVAKAAAVTAAAAVAAAAAAKATVVPSTPRPAEAKVVVTAAAAPAAASTATASGFAFISLPPSAPASVSASAQAEAEEEEATVVVSGPSSINSSSSSSSMHTSSDATDDFVAAAEAQVDAALEVPTVTETATVMEPVTETVTETVTEAAVANPRAPTPMKRRKKRAALHDLPVVASPQPVAESLSSTGQPNERKRVRWCAEIDRSMHAEDVQSPLPYSKATAAAAAEAATENGSEAATLSSRPGYLRGTATQRHRKKSKSTRSSRSKSAALAEAAGEHAEDSTMRRSRTRRSSTIPATESENVPAAEVESSSLGKRKSSFGGYVLISRAPFSSCRA